MPKTYKIIDVPVTISYMVEVHPDGKTEINGWTIEQIIDDWFRNNHMEIYHATRESYVIRSVADADNVKVREIKER